MTYENEKSYSQADYIRMIEKKTASLFELSCSLGVLSANTHSETDLDRLSVFGQNTGIAFQLVDDLIGISGDPRVTGKAVGNDIREGKKTYPIVLVLKKADPQERIRILKVFGSKNTANRELEEAIRIISDLGIEEEIRTLAESYISQASKTLDVYDDSEPKKALQTTADFIARRSL
jgi:geranylgeranyl diphosphate synthase type I